MFESVLASFEMFRDQVWFFRFFLIIVVICAYRTLLHYVLRSNHCANPFCSKCLSSGSVRGRAITHLKDDTSNDENDSLNSIILGNLLQHDRLCHRSDEKPTVYFHRGLSSGKLTLPDETVLVDHYDDLRREMVKFFQENDQIQWSKLYLYENGEENRANTEMFPKLSEILRLLPSAIGVNNPKCLFGNCFIARLTSDLDDGKENKNGLTNCCVRMHFGVICDDASPAHVLIQKRRRLPIENKRTVLYNDALEHSIENPNQKQQIFLTVDLWHPDLSSDMRKQLTSVFHKDLA